MIRLYTFLIFSAIIIVLGYIFFILPQHAFVSETKILIIPENVRIASNADATINDIVVIAKDSVMENDNVLAGDIDVDVKRIKQSNIVSVLVFGHEPQDVRISEKIIIAEIIQNVENVYSLQEDIDVRVVSHSMSPSKRELSAYASILLLLSIAVGVLSGVMAILHLIKKIREDRQYKDLIDGRKVFEKYNFGDDSRVRQVEEKKDDMTDDVVEDNISSSVDTEEIIPSEKVQTESQVSQETQETKGGELRTNSGSYDAASENEQQVRDNNLPSGVPHTPGNLPVVDLDNIGFSQDPNKKSNTEKNEENNANEPTEEELKARLNELLNGKL